MWPREDAKVAACPCRSDLHWDCGARRIAFWDSVVRATTKLNRDLQQSPSFSAFCIFSDSPEPMLRRFRPSGYELDASFDDHLRFGYAKVINSGAAYRVAPPLCRHAALVSTAQHSNCECVVTRLVQFSFAVLAQANNCGPDTCLHHGRLRRHRRRHTWAGHEHEVLIR